MASKPDPFPVDAPDLWVVDARAFYIAVVDDTLQSLLRLGLTDAAKTTHRLLCDLQMGEVGAMEKLRGLCQESLEWGGKECSADT